MPRRLSRTGAPVAGRAPLVLALGCALVVAGCADRTASWPILQDLVASLPLAAVQHEPGLVDLGGPGAVQAHLVRGWSASPVKLEGGDAVWNHGTESELAFYLTRARDVELRWRCAPFEFPGAPVQEVRPRLNGSALAPVRIDAGTREYTLTLPAAALRAGVNRLVFSYAWARSPAEVFGRPNRRALAVAWDWLRFATAAPAAGAGPPADDADEPRTVGDRLHLPAGTRVDYYLSLTGPAALRIDAVRPKDEREAQLAIEIEIEGEPAEEVARFARRERPLGVRLPGDEPRLVRVSLTAQPGEEPGATMILLRPRVVAPAPPSATAIPAVDAVPAPSAANARAAGRTATALAPLAAGDRPNVVLYLVDTLRADRLGAYGSQRGLTPHLDAFAAASLRYEHAVAQAPWTRPSVASIFTGHWPLAHGVNGRWDTLPDAAETLAETLAAAGWHTAAVVTNGYVGPAFGFAQGFETFDLLERPNQSARDVNAVAARRLDELAGEPFFLYLHTLEPHAPYDPPEPYRSSVAGAVPRGAIGSRDWMQRLRAGAIPETPQLTAQLTALYDAEVAAADQGFGEFLGLLETRGLAGRTLVLFVSDHGEQFQEHGGWEHGENLHTELIDVPFLLRGPGLPAGVTRRGPAQHVDVTPTLLSYLGLPPPARGDGRDLLPEIRGDAAAAGTDTTIEAYSYLAYDKYRGVGVTRPDWRAIQQRARSPVELYDRERDPAERRSVAEQNPVLAGYLAMRLRAKQLATRQRLEPGRVVVNEKLDAELRALGYVD